MSKKNLSREVKLIEKLEEIANDTETPMPPLTTWEASTILAMLGDSKYARDVLDAYDKSVLDDYAAKS